MNIKTLFTGANQNVISDFKNFLSVNGKDGIILDYTNLIIPSKYADQENDIIISNANSDEKKAFKYDTQDKLYFTSPLVSNSSINVAFNKHHEHGFQMVGLSYQNFSVRRDINENNRLNTESQIAKYHKYFKDNANYVRKTEPKLIKFFTTTVTPEANESSALAPGFWENTETDEDEIDPEDLKRSSLKIAQKAVNVAGKYGLT